MRYKMNLGDSTLIVDIPHPLFSRAQTAESAAHRRPKPPRIAFERLCGRDPFPERPESTATPEAYNGRMICVESPYPWWTVGKIYEVVDGRITANDGDVYPPRSRAPYRDAEDARHAGAAGTTDGDPRHNRRNLFLPVDAEGRLLV